MDDAASAGEMDELVARIGSTPECVLLPVEANGVIDPRWPRELREFYQRCGGAKLFPESDYPADLLPASLVLSANQVILGEEFDDDPSSDWVTVVELPNGDYLTMDLSPSKAGYIYDSGHEVHGLVGEMPVVARSYAELLQSLLDARGGYWFWLADEFEYLGDAYDP